MSLKNIEYDQNSGISRRSFLTGMGVAGALVATGVVTGCSLASDNSVGSAQSGGDPTSGGAGSGVTSSSWRTVPSPPSTDAISETVDVDVCVVGGGSSGLGAGRSSLLHGAKSVLVLEKSSASRVGGGVHGIMGSSYAKAIGVEYSKEQIDEMIKDEVKMSSMRADERYYRIWAERSAEVFDSMLGAFDPQYVHCVNDGAAPYDQLKDEYFSESVYPGEALQVSKGDVNTPVIDGFTQWIIENGGEIRYSTGGEQLILDGEKVVGVYAIKDDDSYLRVNAKAVIVSGGGFEANEEMVAELAPHVLGSSIANTVPGDGSAIKMCVWAGAQTQISPVCTMMSSAKSPDDPNVPNPIPFICINKNGQRFVNEATSSFVIPYAIMNQPERRAWQIFDANFAQTLNDLKVQSWMGVLNWGEEKVEQFKVAADTADTLAELAQKIGIDAQSLEATVKRYGEMTEAGHDDQFGLPIRFMKAVNPVQAPFYAMEIPYNCLVTLGGIVCDPTTAEVLDANRKPISGLYASGNTVGERFGMAYTNNLCGLSNGFGDVWGYIAGESAGAYITK
jgi:succinate dehydrogenase/fumarate reductase flavoprotein subunit